MEAKKQVWPVMLTPFTRDNRIDYGAVEGLIDWYERKGVDGLFAVCQSSEMFYLSLRERVELAAFVKRRSRLPVIASGHVAEGPDDQAEELAQIAATGVDAVILITNRLAARGDGSDVWLKNLEALLARLDPALPLGLYECPYPYKRLLGDEELTFCAQSGRFRFLKDTCCDAETLRRRCDLLAGTGLGLYNANTTTLLASFGYGAAGFSGVMANFHPEWYVWLARNWQAAPERARAVADTLTVCSQIEKQLYPINAKYHLGRQGLPVTLACRAKDPAQWRPAHAAEVDAMATVVSALGAVAGVG